MGRARGRTDLLGSEILVDCILQTAPDAPFGNGVEVAGGEDGVYDLGVAGCDVGGDWTRRVSGGIRDGKKFGGTDAP